jgi:uncharacterized RDD family membrane protein YckC
VDGDVAPGETRRDPDDVNIPDSPLLRAVARGETDPPPARPVAPVLVPLPARPVAVPPAPAATASEPVAPPPTPVAPPPLVTLHPVAPAPEARRPAAVLREAAPADQTVALRDLAERLQGRPAAEPEIRYAGFFVRLVAFLVDGAVLSIFSIPLIAAGYFGIRAGMVVLGKDAPIEADDTLVTILTAAWFVMAGFYFTIMHRAYGQTIGKGLLGLEVRSLSLAPLGPLQSLLRTLGYVASSMFFGFGFALAGLTPRKRAWHDFLAGTCVVRTTPATESR